MSKLLSLLIGIGFLLGSSSSFADEIVYWKLWKNDARINDEVDPVLQELFSTQFAGAPVTLIPPVSDRQAMKTTLSDALKRDRKVHFFIVGHGMRGAALQQPRSFADTDTRKVGEGDRYYYPEMADDIVTTLLDTCKGGCELVLSFDVCFAGGAEEVFESYRERIQQSGNRLSLYMSSDKDSYAHSGNSALALLVLPELKKLVKALTGVPYSDEELFAFFNRLDGNRQSGVDRTAVDNWTVWSSSAKLRTLDLSVQQAMSIASNESNSDNVRELALWALMKYPDSKAEVRSTVLRWSTKRETSGFAREAMRVFRRLE